MKKHKKNKRKVKSNLHFSSKSKIPVLLLATFFTTNFIFAQPAHANGLTDTVSSYWTSFTNWLWGEDSSSSEPASYAEESSSAEETPVETTIGSAEEGAQIISQIQSNNGVLPENVHIKAKKKQEDGTWRVVIGSSATQGKEVDFVLSMNEAGEFTPINLSDDDSMQKEYEAIMSGNELSSEEVAQTDATMHDLSIMTKTLKDDYGLSAKTLAATAAGAATLGGLYLAGYGIKGRKPEEIEEAVSESYSLSSSTRSITTVDLNAVHESLAKMPNTITACDKAMYSAVATCISSTTSIWQGESLEKLASYIITTANKYGLNPMVVTAQLKQESGFNPTAGSSAGAQGIAQFIPSTAAAFGINPWSVTEAIEGQCKYMSSLMKNFGDYTLALAGYNAGGGAVSDYGGVPPYPETQNYIKNISAIVGDMADDYDKAVV